MRFKDEVCEKCGLDLTTAKPARVREMPLRGEMVFLGKCPQCLTNCVMVPSELEVAPAAEPEPEAEIEPGETEEPEEEKKGD